MKKAIYVLVFIAIALAGTATYFLLKNGDVFKRKEDEEEQKNNGTPSSSSSSSNTSSGSSSSSSGGSSNSNTIEWTKPLISANEATIREMQRLLNLAIDAANTLNITNVPNALSVDGQLGNKSKGAFTFAEDVYLGVNTPSDDPSGFKSNTTLNNVKELLEKLYQKYF